jgi:hypothetical protein
LHLSELIDLTCGSIEEIELVERPHYLIALLSDVKISQLQSSLCQTVEKVLLLQLLACLERNIEVPTGQSQVETLPDILLEEKSNLSMALVFQVANDGVATEVSSL